MEVPAEALIETPRLVLRPHRLEDFADCAAMWRDPSVVGLIGKGEPLTDEDVWSRLLRYAGCWGLLGYGYWAVRERDGGGFVGDVGFQHLRRAADPALPNEPEIGWVLAASKQGQGYAREAVSAALAWADAHLTATETVCIIRPEHHRSIRIAEAAGYGRLFPATLRGEPIDVFVRPRGFQTDSAAPNS